MRCGDGLRMAKLLCFHPKFPDDVRPAAAWYDEKSIALGNRFRAAVNDRLDAVEKRPASFARIDGELRAAIVRGFPYIVVFEDHSTRVDVVGLFHAAADPSAWRARIR